MHPVLSLVSSLLARVRSHRTLALHPQPSLQREQGIDECGGEAGSHPVCHCFVSAIKAQVYAYHVDIHMMAGGAGE
jgi:hypothetical protein